MTEPCCVYRLTYPPDPRMYWGTSSNPSKRLCSHGKMTEAENAEIRKLLLRGHKPKMEIVGWFPDRRFAVAEEERLISLTSRHLALNRQAAISCKRGRTRTAGSATCSLCRRHLPCQRFNRDGGRHNGLSSKCRECRAFLWRMTAWERKQPVPDISAMWQAAKAALRCQRWEPEDQDGL